MVSKHAPLRKVVDKQPPKLLKLDVGSGGPSSDDSFTSVDAYVDDVDVKAFMWDMPFVDGEVDTIWCSNALEHVSKFNVVPTLKEFLRVLKPGGKLQVIVPDLEWACHFWLDNPSVNWSLDIIYGHQKHEGEYHRTGFNEQIIRDYFEACGGFTINKIERIGGEGKKKRNAKGELYLHVDQGLFNIEAWKTE